MHLPILGMPDQFIRLPPAFRRQGHLEQSIGMQQISNKSLSGGIEHHAQSMGLGLEGADRDFSISGDVGSQIAEGIGVSGV